TNPNVQLLVDRYDEDWNRLAFVQLRGRAELLAPGAEHAEALGALRAKYPQYASMSLEDPDDQGFDIGHDSRHA
ncbi:MAG TPA: F420-dependent protein, partial [Dehalococcoidia bacterium]|nr:F420-dependent protein [Dehalococcoidia bacterium]